MYREATLHAIYPYYPQFFILDLREIRCPPLVSPLLKELL